MDFETLCIHGHKRRYDEVGAVVTPIFASATFSHPGLPQEAEFEYSRLKMGQGEKFIGSFKPDHLVFNRLFQYVLRERAKVRARRGFFQRISAGVFGGVVKFPVQRPPVPKVKIAGFADHYLRGGF